MPSKLGAGTHGYRNDGAVVHISASEPCTNLGYGELFSVEITVHKLFAGLCHCLKQTSRGSSPDILQ